MNYSQSPPTFPCLWAAEWGEDEYGLWQALVYKDVRYAFRWIEAGEFLMGSPEDEPEREAFSFYEKEKQHHVTLIHGFWLGETTVTQALWQAITGNNPSHFDNDKHNPVEGISWNDSITFIEQLNDVLAQANILTNDQFVLRLPSEAEWEYACRAGTETPFYFGKNITTDLVNYNGNFPYHNAQKGEYRKKTMPVKSFPCNTWGLYEMHGNVWEWCHDWFYLRIALSKTSRVKKSSDRVLRGGSWGSYGRKVRSAYCNHYSPDSRYHYIGLRLALGQPI